MEVLLINGSPNRNGSTNRALEEVEKGLKEYGVATKILHVGNAVRTGCMGCGGCAKTHRCVFQDDAVNAAMEAIERADGYVFGSPVHYANMSGNLKCFMDRVFMANGGALAYKPGAALVCARRGGTTAAYESILKYFGINNMPIVSANYWNQLHGHHAEEIEQDLEGLQTARILGRNMGWLVSSIACGKENGVVEPQKEAKIKTSFIR